MVGRFTWRETHRLIVCIWWGVSPVWSDITHLAESSAKPGSLDSKHSRVLEEWAQADINTMEMELGKWCKLGTNLARDIRNNVMTIHSENVRNILK